MCLDAKGGAAGRSDGPAHQHVVGEHEIGRQQRAKRSRVRFDVRASLGLAEVLEELRLEPLVPIHDEHGQQPTRKIDGNRLRAAEVVLLRRAFLRDDDDLVSPAAPLTRERAGVDIRPGSSEEVTVPEQDAHRQQANSEAGCRRSRNQLRVSASFHSSPAAQSNRRRDRYRQGVIRCRALLQKQRAGGSRTRINKDRTAGIEPRCDFLTVIPLLSLVNAIATAWGGSRVLSLTQQPAVTGAAYGVFCGLQVTEFDSFLRFFLCHFILLSNLVWPSVNFHLENSFLAVH